MQRKKDKTPDHVTIFLQVLRHARAILSIFEACPLVFLPAVCSGALVRAHLLLSDWSSLFFCDCDSGSCGHPVILRDIVRFWEAAFCFLRSETVVASSCSLLAHVHREVFLAVGSFRLAVDSSDIVNNETFSSCFVLNFSSTTLRHKQVQKSPIQSYLAGLFDSRAWLILHLNWENGTHIKDTW